MWCGCFRRSGHPGLVGDFRVARMGMGILVWGTAGGCVRGVEVGARPQVRGGAGGVQREGLRGCRCVGGARVGTTVCRGRVCEVRPKRRDRPGLEDTI